MSGELVNMELAENKDSNTPYRNCVTRIIVALIMAICIAGSLLTYVAVQVFCNIPKEINDIHKKLDITRKELNSTRYELQVSVNICHENIISIAHMQRIVLSFWNIEINLFIRVRSKKLG